MNLLRKSTASAATPAGESAAPNPSRRSFLQRLGTIAVLASFGGFTYQVLRSLMPNVLYEPGQRVKIGHPSRLPEGITFLEDQRLFVFRNGRSFYAISAACTHLGCTVKYAKLNQPKRVTLDGEEREVPFEFHCPCHGSKYYADGTNYSGPAPRPLRWYALEIAPDDGQLVVDTGTEVKRNFRLTV